MSILLNTFIYFLYLIVARFYASSFFMRVKFVLSFYKNFYN